MRVARIRTGLAVAAVIGLVLATPFVAPAPPAEGEVAELAAKLRKLAPQNPLGIADPTITRAAELLERHAAPVPVPVDERLPGPEDCVPHPRTKLGNWCWGFERCEVSLARPARWRLMHMETVEMEASHWLEAQSLPLPAPQGGEVEP